MGLLTTCAHTRGRTLTYPSVAPTSAIKPTGIFSGSHLTPGYRVLNANVHGQDIICFGRCRPVTETHTAYIPEKVLYPDIKKAPLWPFQWLRELLITGSGNSLHAVSMAGNFPRVVQSVGIRYAMPPNPKVPRLRACTRTLKESACE